MDAPELQAVLAVGGGAGVFSSSTRSKSASFVRPAVCFLFSLFFIVMAFAVLLALYHSLFSPCHESRDVCFGQLKDSINHIYVSYLCQISFAYCRLIKFLGQQLNQVSPDFQIFAFVIR